MRSIFEGSDTGKKYAKECAGKVGHKDETAAMKAVHKIAKKEPRKAFRPYFCSICRMWHVGTVGADGK